MLNKKIELLEESYLVSDIKNYFEPIMKKHDTFTHNLPKRISITLKIKKTTLSQTFMSETMNLIRSTKGKITRDENVKIAPHVEFTEIILVHFNIVNNDY